MTAIRFPVDYEFDWSIYPSVTGVTNEGEHRIAVQERSGIQLTAKRPVRNYFKIKLFFPILSV